MTRGWVWLATAVLAVLVLGPVAWWQLAGPDPRCGGTVVGGGSIGGPFTLVDQTGRTVTEAEVLSEPALVYFGYTYCPDICPFDVARNADAVDLLAEEGFDVRPVFITVDPARDTVESLRDYAGYMHPDLVALTGTEAQVDAAADAYRVYYSRGEGEGDSYLVDHSTNTYLMLPDTGFADAMGRDLTAEEVAERTACYLT